MEMSEFLDLCRRMVVLYWNTFISPDDEYNREIDIHAVCVQRYEEDDDGSMKMAMVVNGDEQREFNVEYNPYVNKIDSYIS